MTRRLLAAILAVVAILAGLPGMALAADPPSISGTVTDLTGRLAGAEPRVQAAADSLRTERGIDYYVVFVSALDGEDPAVFVERTAAANALVDKKAVILLVSIDDRQIALWSSGSTDITTSELDTIRESEVVPKLRAGDFVGATEAAAVGFARADAEVAPAAPAPTQPAPRMEIDWTPWVNVLGVMLGIFVVVVVVAFAGRIAWGAYNKGAQLRRAEREMRSLAAKARTTLLAADNSIRDAEQELAFAEAQFGPETLVSFRKTLSSAEVSIRDAYQTAQRIDDDEPESQVEREAMFKRIVGATESITKSLRDQKTYLDNLRRDEQAVADSVKQLTLDAKIRARAIRRAQEVLDRVQAHAASAYESVQHNVEVAKAKFDQADAFLAEAQERIDEGLRPKATLLLREATSAIAEGKSNLDAIGKVGTDLTEAERKIDAEIASATAEIAKAESAVKRESVSGLSQYLTEARRLLKAAMAEHAKPNADFLVAYEKATAANAQADRVLDGVRDEQERRQRAVEQAEAQIRQAKSAIDQAEAYITSHRGTVGRKARTRLSEAKRHYAESQAGDLDLYRAAAIAVTANSAASDAYAIARREVSDASVIVSSVSPYDSGSSSSSSYESSSSRRSSSSYGSSSSGSSWGSDSFSIGSFGGGSSSSGSFGGGRSSGGGW